MFFLLFFAKEALSDEEKFKKGMRYEYSYLIEVALFMKSYSTYKFLRESKIIPLPSPTTQRKLLGSSECPFGFNELVLDTISEKLKGVKDLKKMDNPTHIVPGLLLDPRMSGCP